MRYVFELDSFLFLYESTLLRNWNHSNRIILTKVMALSCQLIILPITLGTVCIAHFSGVLTSCLTLGHCTHLKLRCKGFYSNWNHPIRSTETQVTSETTRATLCSKLEPEFGLYMAPV